LLPARSTQEGLVSRHTPPPPRPPPVTQNGASRRARGEPHATHPGSVEPPTRGER